MGSEARVVVHGLSGLPEIGTGHDLPSLVLAAVGRAGLEVEAGDVFVFTQKVVSKAEGRLAQLADVSPSSLARRWAEQSGKDPRFVEVVLAESARIVRMDRGVLIAETPHGFVCANAGVDASNLPEGVVSLLPRDPDASARALREILSQKVARPVAVVISDTFGRPWREGLVNVAIGVAGLAPLRDLRGQRDAHGRRLETTVVALADELAAAAGLVMAKTAGVPVALVQGLRLEQAEGAARQIVRPPERNLFP